jgi:type II secretion system protein N
MLFNLRGLNATFKGFASWALYCVALVILFLLLTFPYEQLQARVLAEMSRASGLTVNAAQWSLTWPAGLEWRDLVLTGNNIPPLQVARLLLSFRPGSLLEGRPAVTGKAEIRGDATEQRGRVTGRGTLWSWSRPALSHLTATAERVDLGALKIPSLKRGLLRVELEQRWGEPVGPLGAAPSRPTDGRWQVEVTDVQLEQVPLGPAVVPSVGLSTLKGRLQCSEATCRIEMLEGRGPDGTLNGGGTLLIRSPLQRSEITLSVTIVASPEFAQRAAAAGFALVSPSQPMNVTVKGPISNLQVTL